MGVDCMSGTSNTLSKLPKASQNLSKIPTSALSRHSPQGEDGRTHRLARHSGYQIPGRIKAAITAGIR